MLGTACGKCQRCLDEAAGCIPVLRRRNEELTNRLTLLLGALPGRAGDLDYTDEFKLRCFDEARRIAIGGKMTKILVALVGTKYRGNEAVQLLTNLPQGEPLTLVRELDNPHDQSAVQVWARGTCVGYVKSSQNKGIARRMDADPKLTPLPAKLAVDGGPQPMVEIEE